MFGIINKVYPGKQKVFKSFKSILEETDTKIGSLFLISFIILALGIRENTAFITWVFGGYFGMGIGILLCSGSYNSELKDNMISINPPEQWKTKEGV